MSTTRYRPSLGGTVLTVLEAALSSPSDPTRPSRFISPAGNLALLICPGDGMLCVGRSIDEQGRGQLLFAGRRPDGQFPSPGGWLPNWLAGNDVVLGTANEPGTMGVDDSGWRVGYVGVAPTAELGQVYGRNSPIGVWSGGPSEISTFWLEDSTPDRVVNLDPTLFIPGLQPNIKPVSIGPGNWRVPAIVTTNSGQESRGVITITTSDDGKQTGIMRAGRVVAFAAGQWSAMLGMPGGGF